MLSTFKVKCFFYSLGIQFADNTSHMDPLKICRLALSSAVQPRTPKPAKPRQDEEEAMDASSQAEDALSAERWVMDSNSLK